MMSNLTLERRLVTRLDRPRSQTGHHTVIFREEAGGRTPHRVLSPGEPYRPSLLERFGRYEAYAVSASPVLRHRLNEQLKTGGGERRDVFSVHVTVAYHVAQPGVLAERLEDDPLGLLEAEVKTLLRDWASTLSYDALADPLFDAEAHFLQSRQGAERFAGRSRLERLQDLAAALGLEVERVDLTREYSVEDWKVRQGVLDEERQRIRNEARHETEVQGTEHEGEIEARRAVGKARVQGIEHGMRGLKSLIDGLDDALSNVARNTNTPRDLRDAVREVMAASAEMSTILSPRTALPEASGRPVLAAQALPAGGPAEQDLALAREVRRMQEVVRALNCTPAQRAGLAGRILHVLAELCLAQESSNGDLEERLEEVGRFCNEIGIEHAIRDPGQFSYLQRFREPDKLRAELGDAALSF
jgi:hypothetical protein